MRPVQGGPQPLGRGLDAALHETEQRVGVALAGDQGADDGAAGLTHNLGQHRAELQVGVLQRLLDALGVAGLLAHELLAGAQQGAHVLGRRLGHKARPHQAVCQEIGQPSRVGHIGVGHIGVGHIGLAAGHVLHVCRVGQDQGNVAIGEDVPDRLPVDARGFP